jgi:CheY-specific phosphatase CheX
VIANAVERLLPEMAQRTLETMFFAMPDSVSLDRTFVNSGRPSGELIAASLTFHGSTPGRFGLIASHSVAKTLAANFLARDEGASLTQGRVISVIGELANMICGAVLSKMELAASFELSSPESLCLGANEAGPDFTSGSPFISRFEFRGGGVLLLFLGFEESV